MESPDHVSLMYFGRGLTNDELATVLQSVPSTSSLQRRVLPLSPVFLAIRFPPGTSVANIPNAAVCFSDMVGTLAEAEYALGQGLIALTVYRQKHPFEQCAVTQGAFYLSDVASRLYAAGEHVAAGICDVLGVSEDELDSNEKRVSRQSKLAKYLKARLPAEHPLVGAGASLACCAEWFRISGYRAKSVHAQPPTLDGLGIGYRRGQQRWQELRRKDGSLLGLQLNLGGGDPPEVSIDELLSDAVMALRAFLVYAGAVLDFFFSELDKHHIRFDSESGTTTT